MAIYNRALQYLRSSLDNPLATFRDGQWESIEALLARRRILVVQRTGWGKSVVYFLATKLLREQGVGPTLLISPLLSLMRNQIEASERIGIRAVTINSTNTETWAAITETLRDNMVDVLLISPERLANEEFRQGIFAQLSTNIGLVVIDEAHCISDWGHDFRPDYRRIVRVIQALPANVPVLATTATANNRVVEDIRAQIGNDIVLHRGTLIRTSLKLQNITMPMLAARLAWLAQIIPHLPGSGIVYTLTQRDTARVASWLQSKNILAFAYHAGMETQDKEQLEQKLLQNNIKVLVATIALGMGFDKPDLGFVIHFQRPSSVVHYYQQVGRAGRAVEEAYGILLHGEEDDRIADHFIQSAFPPQQHISAILQKLDASEGGLSVPELEKSLNLRKGQIDKALKFLTVESPSPVVRLKSKWQVTATARNYQINQEHIDSITQIRQREQTQIATYMNHNGCLMSFLQTALDDPEPIVCGKCKNCTPDELLDETYDPGLVREAVSFLQTSYLSIIPRKRWPQANMFRHLPFTSVNISADQQAQEGRALSLWRDGGWGDLVAEAKYTTHTFSNELVTACVTMIQQWSPNPPPTWLACIPSCNQPNLVLHFAQRLAQELNIPFVSCIEKNGSSESQKNKRNSYQQAKNLDGAFSVTNECMEGPCLLVDDVIDSGWTFTVATALLRQAGCSAVHPLALAMHSPRMD